MSCNDGKYTCLQKVSMVGQTGSAGPVHHLEPRAWVSVHTSWGRVHFMGPHFRESLTGSRHEYLRVVGIILIVE